MTTKKHEENEIDLDANELSQIQSNGVLEEEFIAFLNLLTLSEEDLKEVSQS